MSLAIAWEEVVSLMIENRYCDKPITSNSSFIVAQLLALDLSLNVEIKLKSMPRRKRRSSAHVRVSYEGVDVRNRTFSDISARPNELEKSYSAGANHKNKERPTISRRHSFTSEQRAKPTESDDILSSRFVHELLSGIDFAGEKDVKVLRPPVAVYTFGKILFQAIWSGINVNAL